MKTSKLPSQEYLLSVSTYDPDSGFFTWKERPQLRGKATTWNIRFANKPALTAKHARGYLVGTIK